MELFIKQFTSKLYPELTDLQNKTRLCDKIHVYLTKNHLTYDDINIKYYWQSQRIVGKIYLKNFTSKAFSNL